MTTTVLDLLKSANAYPVPPRTLIEVSLRRGLPMEDEATTEIAQSAAYNLAKADILMWLSRAPNISQGGQSYSFSEDERTQLRKEAAALYKEYGEDGEEEKHVTVYGYKGSSL